MKFFRNLSIILASVFFILSIVVVLIDILGDYHILINNLNSNQITAIFSCITIVFFVCYLILGNNKKLYVLICTVLLGLTALVSVFIGFVPKNRYTEIVSEDGKHTMVVEEKTTFSSIHIRVYEKIGLCIYNSKLALTLSDKSCLNSYKYGDFYIIFKEKSYDVCIPSFSEKASSISYHKTKKTSD